MAKRWLKVEVTREQSSHIYVCVDDGKVSLSPGRLGTMSFGNNMELRRLICEAAGELDALDWGGEPDFSCSCYPDEVTQEEAEKYDVLDATGISDPPPKNIPPIHDAPKEKEK